jgi:mono/diheme cytochrome c family protein
MTSELISVFWSEERVAKAIALATTACLLIGAEALYGQESWEPAQDPLAGSEVFQTKGCSQCHSLGGLGGTKASDLARIPRRRSFYELAATMWNHVPLMEIGMSEQGIERPQMDAHEAADLIGFLFTLDYFDPPGDVAAGKRLFTEKKCFVCHRVSHYGGEVASNLDFVGQYASPILVAAAMWNHGAPMAGTMEAHGVKRPSFEGSELVDLAAYLESVAPEPLQGKVYVLPGRAEAGRVVFIEKRCNECHSVQGVGSGRASDLAAKGRELGLTEFAATMWNKAPAMREAMGEEYGALPQIGSVEMADLVAYLYSIEYFAEVGDPDVGEQRLRDSGCLSCHSLRGNGGATAVDFSEVAVTESPAEVVAALWNHSFLMEAGPEVVQGPWPTLGAEEMADIIAYLQTSPTER